MRPSDHMDFGFRVWGLFRSLMLRVKGAKGLGFQGIYGGCLHRPRT